MLHLVAFSIDDAQALAQLQQQLGDGDRVILCEAALDWPADHCLLKDRACQRIQPGELAGPSLGIWLAEQQQCLYWGPSSSTTSSSG